MVPGLWGLVLRGGTSKNGKTNQLFFAVGDNFDPNIPPEGPFGLIAATHHQDGDHDDGDDDDHPH